MMNWVDIESTGLDETTGYLLEVALVITDDALNVVAQDVFVIQPEHYTDVWAAADDFVRDMHSKNGLWEAIRRGDGIPIRKAEDQLLQLVKEHGENPLCGSTISFDRRWLRHHMPALEGAFHYRNIDVSTLKETMRRFWPAQGVYEPDKNHRALDDIHESINEFRSYIEFWGWAP